MKRLTTNIRRTEAILGLIYFVLQLFTIPLVLVIINNLLPIPLSDAKLNFAFFALNFIGVTVIFHRYLIESFRMLLLHPKQTIITSLQGFGLYWLGSILINLLVSYIEPEFFNVNDKEIAALADQSAYLIFIGTVVLVPIVEETLYRGLIFGQLYLKNPVLGYIVSVIIFSASHVFGYIGLYSPLQLLLCFLQYIPAGIFLAWAYIKADTIMAPVIIHMTVNFIGMLAML